MSDELCVSLSLVKPNWESMTKKMDKNKDGKVCQSETPAADAAEFEAFVNQVRKEPLLIVEVKNGKKVQILKGQLDALQNLASKNEIKLKVLLDRIQVEDGFIAGISLQALRDIVDISQLKFLKKLQWLDLYFTKVNDINTLKGLSGLRDLRLRENNIRDINALKGLTNLQNLDLGSTYVDDISALKGLTSLQTLNLVGTNVKDINALKGLTNLQTLYLNATDSSDIDVIKGLPNLRKLHIFCKTVSHTDFGKVCTGNMDITKSKPGLQQTFYH